MTIELDTDGDGLFDAGLSPASIAPVIDEAPRIVSAHQWSRGNRR